VRRRRHGGGPPRLAAKILNVTSLTLFTALAVAGFAGSAGTDRRLATWAGSGAGLIAGLVVLAPIPVMPFTGQFARQSTPEAYWASPTFKKINRVLSAGWGRPSSPAASPGSSPRPSSAAAATAWPTCCPVRPSRS
jgi:hypothetical protein